MSWRFIVLGARLGFISCFWLLGTRALIISLVLPIGSNSERNKLTLIQGNPNLIHVHILVRIGTDPEKVIGD